MRTEAVPVIPRECTSRRELAARLLDELHFGEQTEQFGRRASGSGCPAQLMHDPSGLSSSQLFCELLADYPQLVPPSTGHLGKAHLESTQRIGDDPRNDEPSVILVIGRYHERRRGFGAGFWHLFSS